MQKYYLIVLLAVSFILSSCNKKNDSEVTTEEVSYANDTGIFDKANGKLTPEMMWSFGRLGTDIQISPDKNNLIYGIKKYNLQGNTGRSDIYSIPADGGEPKILTGDLEGSSFNAIWRPDGNKIGFITVDEDGAQIWEMNPDGSDKLKITNIENGINGFLYAPDRKHIVFASDVKLDHTTLDLYKDLPEANVRIINDLMYRHWSQWHDYAYSHVFVAAYSDGAIEEAVDIMEGERFDTPMNPWGGMEQINWSADGSKVAYACKKKFGREYTLSTNSEIYIYDLQSKETTNLTENGLEGYDHDPVFSPNGKMIVWKSMEEDGFEADKERMMLYYFETNELVDLSEGFDQNASQFTWAEDNKTIYFTSGVNATYQIYKIDIETRDITQITEGVHNYQSYVLGKNALLACKMSMSKATEIFSVEMNSGEETQLTFTNKWIYDQIKLARVEARWIKTTDEKDMLTWIIYPPDFDPNKKYPTLLYCQGGPQSAVSQFFSYRWNFQIMAAHGYIIVAPNRRGLPTFGQEWNDQISGDYGGQNMKDYFSAIDEMAMEPYVDKNKLGAVGASYGGYSVFWLAGHHEGRFKAFISHCGIFNFESMYGSTEEYFFVNKDYEGAYWEDPSPVSYSFSPHLFVKNWDTPILIISGENDFRIPYTQSMEAFNAAQLLGVKSRLLIFPEETHFVLKPQNAVLWQREFFGWLDTYLKQD